MGHVEVIFHTRRWQTPVSPARRSTESGGSCTQGCNRAVSTRVDASTRLGVFKLISNRVDRIPCSVNVKHETARLCSRQC